VRILLFLLALLPLSSAGQIARTLCADPYQAASAPVAARMTLNGAGAGTCVVVVKPTGVVPTCTFVQPSVFGDYAVGMSVQDSSGAWTTEVVKPFKLTLVRASLDTVTSVVQTTVGFGPNPPEPMRNTPCGDPPVAIVYAVTGLAGTQRDYYNVVNGSRVTTPVGKVVAGVVCDCAKATGLEIIEFNVIRYCKIPGVALVVTNCSLKK
jgi:hypothetical protein